MEKTGADTKTWNEEEIIKEGRVAGIDFFSIYDWTMQEVQDYIDVINERQLREYKMKAYFDYKQANLIAHNLLDGESVPDLMETYNFWSQEDKDEARSRELTRRMMKFSNRKAESV